MFSAKTYIARRVVLKSSLNSGIILLMGDYNISINYAGNCFPFRQNPNFLYYTGIGSKPNLVLLIDIDEGSDCLYGDDMTVEDKIWEEERDTLSELAAKSGIGKKEPLSALKEKIAKALKENRKVHFVSQHRARALIELEKLIGIPSHEINNNTSDDLINAIITQRSVKTEEEIAEIEKALDISHKMYSYLLRHIKPGIYERELVAKIEAIVASAGSNTSFETILTVNGSILHNHYHDNVLKSNDLLLIDSGTKSPEYYSSDITRTYPVNGKFSACQRDIYEIVLHAQLTAIGSMKPGIKYKDIHLKAARIIAEGLKNLGLMKGNLDNAVNEGAHALFFPHGIGHMLGLSTHNMEGWGGDCTGYDEEVERSSQFGLQYLRMGRELKAGFVLTVEPGIYFISTLIDLWRSQNKFTEFINYDKVEEYKGFGGIRIEDDILVTSTSHRVLGSSTIPKEIAEIEAEMNR